MRAKARSVRPVSKHKKPSTVKYCAVSSKAGHLITPHKQNSGKFIALSGDIGSKIIIGISEDDPIFAVGEWSHNVFTR